LKRIVTVLLVAVLVTTMIVLTSTPAFARRAFGGVQVHPSTCQVLADDSALFEWRAGGKVCWFTPPVVSGFSF
jgi:hypothetical protein